MTGGELTAAQIRALFHELGKRLQAAGAHGDVKLVGVASSGDLDSFVAEFNLDTKPATQCLDVLSQGVYLGTINVTVLDAGHPVLADMQTPSQLHLRQVRGLTELPKPVGPYLIDHALLVGIHSCPVNRTLGQ